jgi:UDP-N-acetylglucosamine--N-acetylmuramyl-(pentapeptide) pyrophosphoryl-undecaprenol N-acetylglucosamine transferase
MKLLISGGHLTPALAFIDYLKQNNHEVEVVFAGRLYTQDKEKQPSREREEVERRNVKFIPFRAAKFASANPADIIFQGALFIHSLVVSLGLLVKHRPQAFLSFGGYMAVPLAITSWLLRIPVITHEQTRSAGVANKFIAHFAQAVAISHLSSKKWFAGTKTRVTGNLIRPILLRETPAQPEWIDNQDSLPILYITGGSQGSEVINTTVSHILRQLTKDWLVIHQVGSPKNNRSYERELSQVAKELTKRSRARYYPKAWITEQELAWIYHNTQAVISRAGANTVEEITYFKLPSILIPLPFSHNDEQLANARSLSDKSLALLLPQKDLSPDSLLQTLDLLLKKQRRIRAKFNRLPDTPTDGAAKLYRLVRKTLG